jgi:hypothetical protein
MPARPKWMLALRTRQTLPDATAARRPATAVVAPFPCAPSHAACEPNRQWSQRVLDCEAISAPQTGSELIVHGPRDGKSKDKTCGGPAIADREPNLSCKMPSPHQDDAKQQLSVFQFRYFQSGNVAFGHRSASPRLHLRHVGRRISVISRLVAWC